MLTGALKSQNIVVPRNQLRESVKRVDPFGVVTRNVITR